MMDDSGRKALFPDTLALRAFETLGEVGRSGKRATVEIKPVAARNSADQTEAAPPPEWRP
jgi:hypothetical protein